MNARDTILGRIREALRQPAPVAGAKHHSTDQPAVASGAAHQPREWLPAVGTTFEERLLQFRSNAHALKAEFYLVADRPALKTLLLEIRDREHWTKFGCHRGELTDFAVDALQLPLCGTDKPYAVDELESCSAGITECDALVAQTGSVLLTSRSAGGRALSVLPPHHVVLARREQLLADLPEAFELLKTRYAASYPSFITFITGPSRTGDIERILVLGAHGPKKLTIICV